MGYWLSVRSRWLDIGQIIFFACLSLEFDFVSVQTKNETKNEKERDQYPAILTEQTWTGCSKAG